MPFFYSETIQNSIDHFPLNGIIFFPVLTYFFVAFPVPGLFHQTISPIPVLQMAGLHFLRLNSLLRCTVSHFFIHSRNAGHVGCFHFLASVTGAALNTKDGYLFNRLILFPLDITNSEISRLWWSHFHFFLKTFHIVSKLATLIYKLTIYKDFYHTLPEFVICILSGYSHF